MRHRMRSRTLGRPQGHRISMLRNLTRSLLTHQKIKTTESRAKELARFIEPIINDARKAHEESDPAKKLAHKRRVFRHLITNTSNKDRRARGMKSDRPDRDLASELFDQIAPRFAKGGALARSSGFTRIVKLYPRRGDGAALAQIELVVD